MMINVEDKADDGLERKLWQFDARGNYLVLTRYAEEIKKTTRHKFKGDQWSSNDERFYNSRLDRPIEIPDWVIRQAVKQMTFNVAIGWSNEASVIGHINISELIPPKETE